jgi:hypothetical protein
VPDRGYATRSRRPSSPVRVHLNRRLEREREIEIGNMISASSMSSDYKYIWPPAQPNRRVPP